ncbi:hypothetical protein BDN72DRAFT_471855 [Pluteus cervinus]|uniref:Uncharacterized protein n=1 Tax=Pluteus cervinus TaxID=181527 RepID=A0ACD3A694_9AGAR|nr:hypothetical protein BDN72DRAFT_471855 [Pluteus cervinus]
MLFISYAYLPIFCYLILFVTPRVSDARGGVLEISDSSHYEHNKLVYLRHIILDSSLTFLVIHYYSVDNSYGLLDITCLDTLVV